MKLGRQELAGSTRTRNTESGRRLVSAGAQRLAGAHQPSTDEAPT